MRDGGGRLKSGWYDFGYRHVDNPGRDSLFINQALSVDGDALGPNLNGMLVYGSLS